MLTVSLEFLAFVASRWAGIEEEMKLIIEGIQRIF